MISHTRSIAIAAPPAVVHAYVADATRLPEWAPAFASAVRPEDDHWIVTQGDAEFPIALVADPDTGTADIVSHADRRRGAFTRVVPNGDGSDYSFTLLFPADADEGVVDAQMATVETELAAVRAVCEAA